MPSFSDAYFFLLQRESPSLKMRVVGTHLCIALRTVAVSMTIYIGKECRKHLLKRDWQSTLQVFAKSW